MNHKAIMAKGLLALIAAFAVFGAARRCDRCARAGGCHGDAGAVIGYPATLQFRQQRAFSLHTSGQQQSGQRNQDNALHEGLPLYAGTL